MYSIIVPAMICCTPFFYSDGTRDPRYQLYFLGSGVESVWVDAFSAADDKEAVREAATRVGKQAAEVWRDSHLLARFKDGAVALAEAKRPD